MRSTVGLRLYDEVRRLLKEYDGGLVDICSDIRVSPAWIIQLREGRIKHPSVNRCQDLYERLTGTQLIGR